MESSLYSSKKLQVVQATRTFTKIWSFWHQIYFNRNVFGVRSQLTSKSVVIRTRLDPDLNSLMITSRSFWSISPCCTIKKLLLLLFQYPRLEYPLKKWCLKPSVPTCRGNKAGRDRRKHFSLSRGNDNTALHSYIITFLLSTQAHVAGFVF